MNGHVSALLELGAGFNPEFSGRDNVFERYCHIEAFAITILFVSHAVSDVKAAGDTVLWLDHGRVVGMGETGRIVPSA